MSWREVRADYQGWTNWHTWNTSLMMDNEQETYKGVRKIVEGGGGPDELRDYVLLKVVGPVNRQSLLDAQEWNEIPEHDRLDHGYEDLKEKSPGAADLVSDLGFGPDVSDYQPDLIDPELINWQEIYQNIADELDGEREYEREGERLKGEGLTFHMPGHSDETNYMIDAWLKHHSVHSQDQKLQIPGQDFQPNAEFHTRMDVPAESYRHDPGEESPEQHAEWQQQGVANPRVRAYGWTTLHDIQRGTANEWQRQTMADALAAQGHSSAGIERIMRQQRRWDEATNRYVELEPSPPQPQPNLDEGSSGLTLPEDWRTSAWKEASAQNWVFVNGHVVFGTEPLWEIARKAAEAAGLDDTAATRVSNMIARKMKPTGAAVAVGTMDGPKYPRIFSTNVERNSVMSAVLAAL